MFRHKHSVVLMILAASGALEAQSDTRAKKAPVPPRPAATSRPVARAATADETALAKRLDLPADAVVELKLRKGLSDADLLALPRSRLESTLKKLRNPTPHFPLEWMQSRLEVWKDENGEIPPNALMTAKTEFDELGGGAETAGLTTVSWQALGPGNIGGRVRSIVIHPTTTSTLFCGSVGGGIWKSTNAGADWSPVDDFMGTLAISSILFTPGNPTVMYAGTGESFTGDGLRGAGVFKSVDGGATWAQLASTVGSDFWYVNRLSISPDGAVLLAATDAGILRSADGGASFTHVLSGSVDVGSRDVKFHPTNSSVAVADLFDYDSVLETWFHAIAYSADGGSTFTEAPGTRSNSYDARIETAWHKGWTGGGDGCAYAMRNSANGELFRSVDGGATWSFVSATTILNGTGWYYNTLWVDPSDADANTADDVVLSGGLDMWRSANGGATFTKITEWFGWPLSPHADHHVIVEDPGFNGTTNRRVYIGNDGGVWRTENVHTASPYSGWISRNHQLAITQAYGASRCPLNGVIEMGTQDNGTLKYTPAAGALGWTTTFGGDGGFCASDPTNTTTSYGEYVHAQMFRSSDGGSSAHYIDGKHWNGSQYVWKAPPYRIDDAMNGFASFIAPFVMDPNAPARLLVGGRSLWRTSDAATPNTATTGPSWASIKGPLASNSNITAIAVAASDSAAVWVGYANGHVFSTVDGLNASPTWTRRDLETPNLPNRRITRISIDPSDASHVFVTLGGFNTDNLWQTVDGGANWTAATGMPAVPLRDVERGLVGANRLYVASELGILISDDNGATWTTSTDGPARVSIDELFWSGGYLYAATHGRGMYRATPYPASALSTGTGCQLGIAPPLPAAPTFTAGAPRFGTTVTLLVTSAPYPAPGLVFLSGVPVAPTPVGGACFVHLDLATMAQFATIPTTPFGVGSYSFFLPEAVSLAGFQAAVQVVYFPAGGGLALTNGYVVTVGY
jgi:hypothetical protein